MALQQTTDHKIRYPVPVNTELLSREQLQQQNQQLHTTEDAGLASAALPLSALTANSARAKRSTASSRRRRRRPPPLLALHDDRPSKAIRASYTSTPHVSNNSGHEHDYYSQRLSSTSNPTDPSFILLAGTHQFDADNLIFSKKISNTTGITAVANDNADANTENPASLSTTATRQQPPAPPPPLPPPSPPARLLQRQVEPVSSQWQPYSKPSSIIHHYQTPHTSSVSSKENRSPYRSPNIIAHSQPTSQLVSAPEQQVHYAERPAIPYAISVPSRYPIAETSELMAAAHMQRPPFSQSMYHTPQSSSPTSVVSQQNHHDYSRMYASQPTQLNQPLQYNGYTTTMNQLPSYGHQGHTQGHVTGASPLLLSHQQSPLLPLAHSSTATSVLSHSPTRPDLDLPLQRVMDASRPQSSLADPSGSMGGMHHPPSSSGSGGGGGGGSTGSGAAPGPIPATTPLVVRQDGNGVQWIAFEYSRDRVKMEYTIRCDVESVDCDNLDAKFKTENCVYPRACVPKSEYKGNRYTYESECNQVGWALANLNTCLRTKRGLIQRAVDSWRNSNSDPKIRSRRVRRLAKADKRYKESVGSSTSHTQVGLLGPSRGMPRPPPMTMPMSRGSLGMMTPQLHHHHNAHSEGSMTSGAENVSEASPSDDIRPSHVFHDYPSYMSQQGVYSTSTLPPPPHATFETLGSNGVQAVASTLVSPTTKASSKDDFEEPADKLTELYGDIPPDKYRKFILVRDEERKDYKDCKDTKDSRSRIRVNLGRVNLDQIPDSYRKANSVYPRVYYSRQFVDDNPDHDLRLIGENETDIDGDTSEACISSTFVPIPLLNGEPLALPRISRSKRRREDLLNEIGYRMLWINNTTFPGRPMFMQKCLDLYRKKTREAIENHGIQHANGAVDAQQNEATTIPPQFRLRIGRQKWEARRGRMASMVHK